ncbi:MAG: hypothetical protein GF398_01360 [Chitinivibrionales bacterium]|nr:hypothetical protein [Chitinivibrionales bacterium]
MDAIVIIGATNQKEGVQAEYEFISEKYGKRKKEWKVVAQSISRDTDKLFDIIEIETIPDGDRYFYYFDITKCSWSR